MVDLDGYNRIDKRLVISIVDFQKDIRPGCIYGVQEHCARVEAEITFASIEHNVVIFQVHRTAC